MDQESTTSSTPSKIIRYYLAKFCTFIVAVGVSLVPIIFSLFQYSDQIGQIFVAILTYFIGCFFVLLFKVDEEIDSKRVQISLMIQSFFFYYLFWDVFFFLGKGISNPSSLWTNVFILSLLAYIVASGLQDWENIRQMQQKTPQWPVLFTSIQIGGFLISNSFGLVYGQFFYPQKTFWSVFFQGMLPTLLTLIFGFFLFTTAWKIHKVKIENSPASLIQNFQSQKNKIIFRTTLIAIPIFVIVSIILSVNFHLLKI
jgi:hypothetical protein